jgi:uncharacterized LabA/DUF88 family protein
LTSSTIIGDALDRDDRIALLIDGEHCSEVEEALGFAIDLRRLLDLVASEGVVVHARYYAAWEPTDQNPRPDEMYDALAASGFTVLGAEDTARIRKPLLHLAVDAIDFRREVDHYVIVGGEAGLASLASALHETGAFVTAVSTVASSPPLVADEFRRAVDRFLDASRMVHAIGREPD